MSSFRLASAFDHLPFVVPYLHHTLLFCGVNRVSHNFMAHLAINLWLRVAPPKGSFWGMDNKNAFGTRLRELRESRGLDREDVAAATKQAPETIARYERGERQPRVDELRILAKLLGTSVGYLSGDEPSPTPEKWSQGPGANVEGAMLEAEGFNRVSSPSASRFRDMIPGLQDKINSMGLRALFFRAMLFPTRNMGANA